MNEFLMVGPDVEPINPVALQLGPISLHWYGIVLMLAVVAGLAWAIYEGKKHGLDSDLFMDMTFFGLIAGVLGGRLYYVIMNWSYYNQNPAKIFAVWEGGLAIHGVLIAIVLLVIVFSYRRKISFWKIVDMLAPGLLLAQAIGRWGNFINQEAHGGVVERAWLESWHIPEFIINQMYIEVQQIDGVAGFYFHPTFLYESLWNILGFFLLIGLRYVNWSRFKIRQGDLFFSYLIWYSIGRFYIEGMRTDSLMIGDLKAAQVMSILLIVVAVVAILYRHVKQVSPPYWEVVEQSKPDKNQKKSKSKKQNNTPKSKGHINTPKEKKKNE